MVDPRPCRKSPRRPLASPEPEALEHLEVIRQTMERSTAFTAVSGWGYCAMGVTALVAAPIALRQAVHGRLARGVAGGSADRGHSGV